MQKILIKIKQPAAAITLRITIKTKHNDNKNDN